MNIDKVIERYVGDCTVDGSVKVYRGLAGYVVPIVNRVNPNNRYIKQIINGREVAKLHQATDNLVKDLIAKRVEYGIGIKNLVCYEDRELEIEKSNPSTLKETRFLKEGISHNTMVTFLSDSVSITKLDVNDCVGIIIEDMAIVEMFNTFFDMLWDGATVV